MKGLFKTLYITFIINTMGELFMKKEINEKETAGKLIFIFMICVSMVMTSAITAVSTSMMYTNDTFPFNQMSYSFDFKEPTIRTVTSYHADFTIISMKGCLAVGTQDGNPLMPMDPVQLLLPPQKTVSHIDVVGTPVSVDLSGINLINKPIYPQQKSVPIGDDEIPDFSINSAVYSSNTTYPGSTYTDYKVGYSHGYAILSFCLNPMQYNPVQGTLVYYPEMTVTITLQDTNVANQFYRNNPDDAVYVKTLVSNPEIANRYKNVGLPTLEYPGGLCDPSQKYDYVIVTTTQNGLDHWDTSGSTPYNWDSLMTRHNMLDGLTCTEVLVQDINACPDYWNSTYYPLFNDTQAHIREFCRDAYEDWGTRYILIAGDADTIPARQLFYPYEGNVDSDLYWSNLDNDFNNDHDAQWGEPGDSGFDLYSEIYIGRITCDTPQDVSNWLTKSFYYTDAVDKDYLENTGFYGNQSIVEYSAIKEFEIWNDIHPEMPYNLSVKCTDVNDFKNAINNDQVTLISGVAHGNVQMSLDVFRDVWETNYHNTKPFFIHDYSNHCGDFDDGNDGILDTMLFFSNTTLAFGCVYNTGYGWVSYDYTNSSSTLQQKLFWDYFFDVENNSYSPLNWQLGKAMAYSKDTMAPTINWDEGGSWRGVIEGCLLFGDPAQRIKAPDFTCHPLFNGTQGDNGIFITSVNVSFIFDPETVEKIYYQIESGGWTVYTESFIIYAQGNVDFEWYWVDFGGHESELTTVTLRIDYSKPDLALITPEKGCFYLFGKKLFKIGDIIPVLIGKNSIKVIANDAISGITNVSFSLESDNHLETYVLETPPYIWELTGRHIGKHTLTVTAYDFGGLYVNATLNIRIFQVGIL